MAASIKITVAGADIYLDIKQAMPRGRIADELIVNPVRHTFPGDGGGKSRCNSGRPLAAGCCQSRTSAGLDRNLDLGKSTIFWWLKVGNLVRQIDGTAKLKSNGGTSCRIVL